MNFRVVYTEFEVCILFEVGRIRSLSLSGSIGREIVTSPKFARIRLTVIPVPVLFFASFFLTVSDLVVVVLLIQYIFRVRLTKVRTLRSR